ncbi:MAG: hypothetical protein K0R63_527 [Rickettsiales bacterium]|jgi:4-amino-4-deoxy-L-arabinose transferase-like glycosyltransferase|nr:hypothetical protein [Rickettsiales bacterium]
MITSRSLRNVLLSSYGVAAVIVALTLWRITFLSLSDLPLFFDEAQYWLWGKQLAFGYYSKPPVIGWIIALTTSICGNGETCVRLGSPLLHALTAWIIFLIGRKLWNHEIGTWSALTYATLPAVTVSSALISTDAPFLFFWALTLYCFLQAREDTRWHWWIATGAAAGFGMLTKYSMLLFFPSVLLFLWLSPQDRKLLTNKKFWGAVGVAFLLFLPNLCWNAMNGFVSFLHTKDNAALEGSLLHPSKMLEFVGAQFGVFGPVLFSVLLWRVIQFKKTILQPTYALLISFVVPFLGTIVLVSFLSRAHANWAAPTYIAATLLVVGWLYEKERIHWLKLSLGLHLVVFFIATLFSPVVRALHIPLSAKHTGWNEEGTFALRDPFERLRGMDLLGEKVATILMTNPKAILVTDERKTLAPLIYYVEKAQDFPNIIAFAKWNPEQDIDDHYELITDLTQHRGEDILFVTRTANPVNLFATSAESYQHLPSLELPLYPDKTLQFEAYYLHGFKGYQQ